MGPNSQSKGPIRFGVFEVDLSAHVLRKNGAQIRLQEKPFRLLVMLLSRAGEMVTREDLQNELWPGEEYGEFDLGLNTAVKKLRQALGDSAGNPNFIETVPRLGYRFIYPIANPSVDPGEENPKTTTSKRGTLTEIAVAATVLLSAIGLTWWLTRPAESTAPTPQFQLRPITRDTGYTAQPALSPDGKLLAYVSDRESDQTDIWVQQLAGGEPIRLTTHEADDAQPAFSPDGSRIVFVSDRDEGGVYTVPALGGEARRIADKGVKPRFSPDGNWVSYARVESDRGGQFFSGIYLVSSSGGPSKLLETGLAMAGSPVWSPDGAWLLLHGSLEPAGYGRLADAGWWIVPSMGGRITRVDVNDSFEKLGVRADDEGQGTFRSRIPEPLAWLDGERILFDGRAGDGGTNLWQIRMSQRDGRVLGDPQRLTTGTGESAPSASTDGLIAFVSSTIDWDIWSLPLDANRAQVTNPLERVVSGLSYDAYPSISGDARKLAYTSNRSGNLDIWLRDLETGKDTAVTVGAAEETRGEITEDGTRIAFRRATSRGKADILIIDLRRGTEKLVIEGAANYLDWMPDERRLVFYTPPPVHTKIADVESGEQLDLGLNHPDYRIEAPRFSPDGNWLAFNLIVAPGREAQLFISPCREGRPAGRDQWIKITQDFADVHPWWSPDGNILYFLSMRDRFFCIWAQALDPNTKKPELPPRAVQHFHGRLRIRGRGQEFFGYAMTRDRLFLPLSESRANIWLAEPIAAP